MASIRLRAGRWQARVKRIGFDEAVRSFDTQQDAERWARSVEVDMDRGKHESSSKSSHITLGELISRYIVEVLPSMKGVVEDTFRLKAILRRSISNCEIGQLSPSRIATYRDQRLGDVSAGTVIRELAYLSSIINHARKEWGVKAENPVALVRKPPSPPGRNRLLTDSERERLFEALLPVHRKSVWALPTVELALATAMRRGELLALRWDDISIARRTAVLHTSKNGEGRVVPLSSVALRVLGSIPKDPTGKVLPIEPATLSKCFERAVKQAEIVNLRFHDLRHVAISSMAERLPNLIELSAVSGHKSLKMLQRYYHPDAEKLALKLG